MEVKDSFDLQPVEILKFRSQHSVRMVKAWFYVKAVYCALIESWYETS